MKQHEIICDDVQTSIFRRSAIYNMYLSKYFGLFMSAYRFTGITEDQADFLLRRLWSRGRIAAFIVEGTKPESSNELASVNDYPNGMIAFTDFAPCRYNIYDWPIAVNLVASRGATFIPRTPQNVNSSCVIGYVQKNKLPVKQIAEYYVSLMTDVEMTIKAQLRGHKAPWTIATTPENEKKIKALYEKLISDDEALFASVEDIKNIQLLITGQQYIIDKLYAYKQAVENELLTYLGIDNLGTMQKKEHFVVDEVNSNNDLINDFSDSFIDSMKSFCERVRTFLGFEMNVEAVASPVAAVSEVGDKQNEMDQ